MTMHPSCDHPTSDVHGFAGVVCCICDGRACPAVTVELMADHRLFDIELWSEVGQLVQPPF